MTDTRTEIHDAGRLRAQWAGLLLAPAAWLASLEVGYLLVRPGCLADTALPQHAAHAAFLLLALGGLVVAWRVHRVQRDFLATLGIGTSALFALVLVAQWIPTFLIQPCQ